MILSASRPFGSELQTQPGKEYSFEIEFRGAFLTVLRFEGESILPFHHSSLREAFGSTLRLGHLGLYAYNQTQAQISIEVNPLPTRCFVITNIDGHKGSDTTKRRKFFEKLLRLAKIENVEFYDSRDLTREVPLMPKIRDAIVATDFVIADLGLGSPRPNVFYETGIAHTVGMPVIHVGPNETRFKGAPSDLKSQFFVLEHELKTKLAKTVKTALEFPAGDFSYLG